MDTKLPPVTKQAWEEICEDAAYLWVWLEDIGCTDAHAFKCVERIRHNRDVLAGVTDKPFEEARKEELAYIKKTYE